MRVRKIIHNVLSTWVGYGITLLAGFLLSPYIVHHLGNTGYGIWVLIMSLTGYFGMLDLGLRQSVGRYVARFMGLGDYDSVNRTIVNALVMLSAGGILAAIATLVVTMNFGVFKVEPRFAFSAKSALLIVGLNICLALPMSVFNTLLFSLERFAILTSSTVIATLIRTGLVIWFLHTGSGVMALACITLLASCTEYLINVIAAKVLFPNLNLDPRFIDWARCKELFGFGIFRFVWIVANQLIFYTDSIVIGLFLNAAAITYYAIAGSLINYGRNIVSLAVDTLYPAANRLDACRNTEGLRQLQIVGTQLCLLIGLPICIGYVFFGKEFIVLWMGNSYASSAIFLLVLTISQFVSMSQYASALVLVSMAKHKVLAYVAIAEGVANLLLSIVLVQKIGLIGVAIGTVIPQLITMGVVLPVYTMRVLGMQYREYVSKALLRPFIVAVPAALTAYAIRKWPVPASWLSFTCESLVYIMCFITLSFAICLTSAQRDMVLSRLFSRQLWNKPHTPCPEIPN